MEGRQYLVVVAEWLALAREAASQGLLPRAQGLVAQALPAATVAQQRQAAMAPQVL
ncbi:hypothetical protein [Pseudomonas sp. HY13-MNA-CIBAN-0226]|uniref:hypothetical protein n=1 Tax=Pseudomonas sp. HY13-MNA-CIBAN-0226 TaxID=3140473 RepID=UPI003328A329